MIRGSVLRVGGYVAGLLLSLGSAALLIRHLGVVDAGRYVTVLSLIAIAVGVSDLGLTTVGVREYTTRDGPTRARFMANLLGMRIVLTSIGITAALIFAAAVDYTSAMVTGSLFAGLGFLFAIIQATLTVPLLASLRLGWVSALQLVIQACALAIIAALVIADAGLVPLLAAQGVAVVPALGLTAVIVYRETPLRPAFDRGAWRELLRDILPYAAAVTFGVLYFRVAMIMVSLLSTEQQAGYFGAAFRVIDAITLIPPLLISSAFPILTRAARDDRERLAYALDRLFRIALILGVWLAIGLIVGAEAAIDAVAGGQFEPSVEVLQALGVALVGTFLLATWGHALLALRQHREIGIATGASFTLAVALSVRLVPDHGAMGAAISLVASELALAAMYAYFLMRTDRRLTPATAIAPRVALAAAPALALPLALDLPSLAGVGAATALYLGALALLRAIPQEAPDALLGWMRRPAGPPHRRPSARCP